jgi:hypothetical protein
MSYIKKNIQSLINRTDACGAGMKKSGLVYGSDWARLRVNSSILSTKTPSNIVFSTYGTMKNCCGQTQTTGLNPSQRAYRNPRTAFN